MSLKVLGDRILVRRAKKDDKTAEGIIIPEQSRALANRGTVAFVGTGRTLPDGTVVPSACQVGDHVLFEEPTKASQFFDHEGERFIVLAESQILAIEQ